MPQVKNDVKAVTKPGDKKKKGALGKAQKISDSIDFQSLVTDDLQTKETVTKQEKSEQI
jgi:hypothetical protein